MLQTFITPHTFHIYICQNIFCSQVENEVKVVVIQEAVTDELKNVQKEEFLAAFHKVYDRAKAYIYVNGAYFE